MVSLRCKMVVHQELEKLGVNNALVELGTIELLDDLNPAQLKIFSNNLKKLGLELLDDKKSILIEKIKAVVIEMIHSADGFPNENFSDYISKALNYDYTYLANTFSEVKGITLQHYIILNKIEKVKELILYNELNLTEIAYQLNYGSVSHLSAQFKKITGLSPSFYKKMKHKRKENLEDL